MWEDWIEVQCLIPCRSHLFEILVCDIGLRFKHWELTPADIVGDAVTASGEDVLLVFVP